MTKKIKPVLFGILNAITGIEQSLAGKSFHDSQSDWLINHGIQRGIEIISEASRCIPPELQAERADIPWRKIAAIGNILRHEYHDIQDEVVWDVAVNRLAPLKVAVTEMMSRMDE